MRTMFLAMVAMVVGAAPALAQTAKEKADAAYYAAAEQYGEADASKTKTDGSRKTSSDLYLSVHLNVWFKYGGWWAKTMSAKDYNTCSNDFKYANEADAGGDSAYATADDYLGAGNVAFLVADEFYADEDYVNAAKYYGYALTYYTNAKGYFDGSGVYYGLAVEWRIEAALILSGYPLPAGDGGPGGDE